MMVYFLPRRSHTACERRAGMATWWSPPWFPGFCDRFCRSVCRVLLRGRLLRAPADSLPHYRPGFRRHGFPQGQILRVPEVPPVVWIRYKEEGAVNCPSTNQGLLDTINQTGAKLVEQGKQPASSNNGEISQGSSGTSDNPNNDNNLNTSVINSNSSTQNVTPNPNSSTQNDNNNGSAAEIPVTNSNFATQNATPGTGLHEAGSQGIGKGGGLSNHGFPRHWKGRRFRERQRLRRQQPSHSTRKRSRKPRYGRPR